MAPGTLTGPAGSIVPSGSAAPTGRSFAPIVGTDEWLRCGHTNTSIDLDDEVVTLAWQAAADAAPWSTEGPASLPESAGQAFDSAGQAFNSAGLAFDGNGCLYHGDPERGQIQRVPWGSRGRAGAAAVSGGAVGAGAGELDGPVDLLSPPPAPVAEPGGFHPVDPDPAPGLAVRAVALAADADEHLFVLDGSTGNIFVLDLADGHLVRIITVPWLLRPVDLATSGRTILIATDDRAQPLVTVDALGLQRPVELSDRAASALELVPADAVPRRVAVGPAGERWLLLGTAASAWAVPIDDDRRSQPIEVAGATDIELDGRSKLVVAGPASGPAAGGSGSGGSGSGGSGSGGSGSGSAAPARTVFRRFILTKQADAEDVPLSARSYDGRGIVRTPDGRIGYWSAIASVAATSTGGSSTGSSSSSGSSGCSSAGGSSSAGSSSAGSFGAGSFGASSSAAGGFRVALEARRSFSTAGHVDGFRLDSGAYQQQWGRVFIEACIPKGASVHVGFVTADDEPDWLEPEGPSITAGLPVLLQDGEEADTTGSSDPSGPTPGVPPLVAVGHEATVARPWALHRRETGSELPWFRPDPGDRFEVYEAPVQAPPGRFLWLRLMLSGTGTVTPQIRAVRAEFPGHDLLRRLPRAYSRDPAAASFLRRYLALADGVLSEMELRAAQRDLLLDPFGAPPEVLPWLASLIGLTLDGRWPEAARRQLLSEAICLFRRRGTIGGLRRMLQIYLDCDVVIVEAFRLRGAGGAFAGGPAGSGSGDSADAIEGSTNAIVGYGFRVGGEVGQSGSGSTGSGSGSGGVVDQPLSGTVADAFATHAHRFSVIVPRDLSDEQLQTVNDLLDLHRPAHTLVEVCAAGRGMRVGIGLHVEMSTVVGPSSAFRRSVVGESRVGVGSVLGKPRAGVRPGGSHVGTDTVLDP